MEWIKKSTMFLGVFIFLVMALTLNFVLQKDYFLELGFTWWIIVLSILLLDGTKILSEILFFKYKGRTQIFLGIFSVTLILLSAYTTFGVREWKSVAAQLKSDNKNDSHITQMKMYKEQKGRLDIQFNSLEKQIKMKEDLINSLKDDQNGKWLRHRYNKEIGELNKEKEKVLIRLDNLDKENNFNFQKEVTLTDALSISLGIQSDRIETATNAIIALTVEGIIIFLCFSISHFKFIVKRNKKADPSMNTTGNMAEEAVNPNEINGMYIRRLRRLYDLTQNEMSELIEIPRGTLAKLETGRSEITPEIIEKIKNFEKTIEQDKNISLN